MNQIESFKREGRNEKIKNALFKTLIYSFLVLCALAVLFPFYWMVLTSLKDYGAYTSE